MTSCLKWLLPAAALAAVVAAVGPAAAQPYGYGYGDDGPPPFRRGPGWDGPPRWDRWHHRRGWRDEGFDRRGWRDGDRREGRDRFGEDGGGRNRGRNEDARRGSDEGVAPQRGGGNRNGPRQFGNDSD